MISIGSVAVDDLFIEEFWIFLLGRAITQSATKVSQSGTNRF